MMHASFPKYFTVISLFALFIVQTLALAIIPTGPSFARRTVDPYFPGTPPSCPICEKDYSSINSCAAASPVLSNFSMIIFNPSAFIDVIKCACADTFQSAFPQCVDCFVKTGQDNVIEARNLPAIIDGMRRICAIQSTLLGNVSGANHYFNSTRTQSVPTPTASSSRGLFLGYHGATIAYTLLFMGVLFLV